MKHSRKTVSVEAKLDRQIEELIAKMVRQELTADEILQLRQLVAQRSRRMRRTVPSNMMRSNRVRLYA